MLSPSDNPSGLHGAIPTVYDPAWQSYTDLTQQQIDAFKSFPQDLIKYIGTRRWHWEICSSFAGSPASPWITLPGDTNPNLLGMQLFTDLASQQKIAGLKQAIDAGIVTSPFSFIGANGVRQLTASDVNALYGYVVRWVQQTYSIASSLLAGVAARTVTNRVQIDAAFSKMQVT